MNPDETTIAIMGQNVSARHELMDIDQLHFLPDNPRVYASIREMPDFIDLTPEEKQARIYRYLIQEPSVKNLIPEIRRDGGLQEPIIVRHDTRQVIEGNSRLAAYRKLKEEADNEKWTHIRCLVVSTLTDDQQTRLLGQIHLHGRTEWSPYAKALFCFRWVEEEKKKPRYVGGTVRSFCPSNQNECQDHPTDEEEQRRQAVALQLLRRPRSEQGNFLGNRSEPCIAGHAVLSD